MASASTKILLHNLSIQYSKICMQTFSSCSKNALRSNRLIQYEAQHTIIEWRYSHSFFSRTTAEQLWKGVTSVSPAGRRKGRARGANKKLIRDLNKGQVIGFGKKNMLWPGLNAPIVQGREVLRQQELPPDENRQKRLLELRDKLRKRKTYKVHPLERGWSGNKLPGRRLGPPDPVGDEKFLGFESICLQHRIVMHMHGQRGKIRSLSSLVAVGNGNGLAGFAYSKSTNGLKAALAAKNKAAKVLRYIERDNNTVIHDFFTQYGAVKIFVERRPEGYGLCCHRAIKAMCKLIGIKDLWAKVEGPSRNTICLSRAFFIGLMKQRSLKDIANEKGLYIIKKQNYRDGFAELVAAPDKCRTEEEIGPTELLDFNLHLHDGKVIEERKPFQPFYINFPSYIKEMKDRERIRNLHTVRLEMFAKYGEATSFVQIREKEKAAKELKNTVEGEEENAVNEIK